MSADYVILAVFAVLTIGGGVFLLFQAKNYRARHHLDDEHLHHPSPP